VVGESIVTLLWGGYSVDNPTLNRFFALHYLLPFMIAGVVVLHVWALHVTGQNNPTGVDVKSPKDTVAFTPYATLKDVFGISVFLILYLTRSGYSAAQAGVAVGAYGIGAILASLIGGFLADRIGRRGTIALSMLTAAVAILALERARSFTAILVFTAFTGLTAEAYRPAASALLGDLVEPARRVTAFAWYRLAINVGAALGPIAGGWIAERSFRWLFWGDALTCALYGLLALVALPPTRVLGAAHPADSTAAAHGEVKASPSWLRRLSIWSKSFIRLR